MGRIRGVGLRVTPGRVATYRTMLVAAAPLSHAEVVARIGSVSVDRATIYRNLMDLTEAGLLLRSDHGDHKWRFEAMREHEGPGHHAHFVCIDCGGVACLDDVDVSIRPGRASPQAVRDARVQVQLRGRCDECG